MLAEKDDAASPLKSSRPPFLDLLDRDPDSAWAEFYAFATRLIKACPPRRLRAFPAQDHEDLISELIIHFGKDSFRVLKTYHDRGKPFAAWFLHVANNFLSDRMPRPGGPFEDDAGISEEDEQAPVIERLPDVRPGGLDLAMAAQWREILDRCLAKLSRECQILLQAALVDGVRPRELVLLLGRTKGDNKAIGDKVKDCRKSLARKLIDEGLDPRWFARPKPARQPGVEQ